VHDIDNSNIELVNELVDSNTYVNSDDYAIVA